MRHPHFYIFLFLLAVIFSCEKREFESKPGVVTGSVSEITIRSANIKGNIIDLGSGITNHGHCWSTTPQPIIANSKTSLGKISSLGEYTSELINLDPGVTYFVRAFVSDNNETFYGKEISFTSLSGQAGLTTSAISDITINSAKCGGNITDDGGANITARGVCWSTSQDPTVADNKTHDGSGTGSFTSDISGLQPNTTYYVRTYATNSVTTSYGNQQSFSTQDGLATVTTASITNITINSATSGGNISENGGTAIEVRGVCWSTDQNPTINDSKTTDGNGTGSFTSSITGLLPNTTYYVRVYATNNVTTSYGNQQSFSTKDGLATLTTNTVTDITINSATSGGNITDDSGITITARGVCWSINQNPNIADNKTNDGSGMGIFTSNLTGLQPGINYYVRAYATNSYGTTYGDEFLFRTFDGTFTDSRDGVRYYWIEIGNQIWMAENLAWLPSVSPSSSESYTSPYYYVYGYQGTSVSDAKNTSNYSSYGVLYNWPAAKQSCPDGWNLPTDAEWIELVNYLGGGGVAGGKLKETEFDYWNSPNIGATNETGFTALPGGYRDYRGSFFSVGDSGVWWSASEGGNNNAWYWYMNYNYSSVNRYDNYKAYGLSVRCLRDQLME